MYLLTNGRVITRDEGGKGYYEKGAVAYEDWLAEADDDFAWGAFDENTAAGLCYTSESVPELMTLARCGG